MPNCININAQECAHSPDPQGGRVAEAANQDAILTHCDRWDIFLPSPHPPHPTSAAFPCPRRPRLHENIPSDRWPRSARKVKGHSIAGVRPLPTPRQLGSVHLAPGGRNESIGSHLPGQSSPFSFQDEVRGDGVTGTSLERRHGNKKDTDLFRSHFLCIRVPFTLGILFL